MTDTTAARRQLLDILLTRAERGALLPAEVWLLRPLVTAEQAAADARPTTDGRRYWRGSDGDDIADAYMTAQAAIARVRALAERWRYVPGLKDSPRTSMLRALDGPSPTPDDTPTPGLLGTVTDWAASVDERCPAHYTGPSPHLTQPADELVDYRCDRRGHGLNTDHAARQDGDVVFCWTDAIAIYPTGDATSEPQP
jgi:hypothetical protein